MIDIFWFIAIIFFSVMTIYNIHAYLRKDNSPLPAIYGFILTLITFLLYLEQSLLIISLLIFALFLFSVAKYPQSSKIQQEKALQELNKANLYEPFYLKDLVGGMKGWGKLALRWGPGRTALLYSASMAFFVGILLLGLKEMIPELDIKGFFIAEMVLIFTAFSYYQMNKTFKAYLDERA